MGLDWHVPRTRDNAAIFLKGHLCDLFDSESPGREATFEHGEVVQGAEVLDGRLCLGVIKNLVDYVLQGSKVVLTIVGG